MLGRSLNLSLSCSNPLVFLPTPSFYQRSIQVVPRPDQTGREIIFQLFRMTSKKILPPFKLILGSSSMSRRRILEEMGYEFSILTADIDEKAIRKDKPEELVTALAEAKADAIISRLDSTHVTKDDAQATLLITADTVVLYRGAIREKPSSKKEAREFIKGYSGSHAAAVGSVFVMNLTTGMRRVAWDSTEVYFHDIPADIIDNLIDEAVTLKVAGGLMLEHPLVLPFVKEVVGSVDTFMGLSKPLTERLIQEVL